MFFLSFQAPRTTHNGDNSRFKLLSFKRDLSKIILNSLNFFRQFTFQTYHWLRFTKASTFRVSWWFACLHDG